MVPLSNLQTLGNENPTINGMNKHVCI